MAEALDGLGPGTDELEELLIGADLGTAVASRVIERFRSTRWGAEVTHAEIRAARPELVVDQHFDRDAAEAMGKHVTRRHLQVFIIGAAVIGLAGAMMVTLDGLMAPNSYNPLRYTFLIWVMVIVGGSGNNWGAVLGALLIWFLWIKAEVWGPALMSLLTLPLSEGGLRRHLIESAPQMRYVAMGLVLLLVLRFAPRGLLPER